MYGALCRMVQRLGFIRRVGGLTNPTNARHFIFKAKRSMATRAPRLWWLWLVFLVVASIADAQDAGPSYRSNYNRISEVKQRCAAVAPANTVMKYDEDDEDLQDPRWMIKNELSFQNGDWKQQLASTEFLPYDEEDNDSMVYNFTGRNPETTDSLKLASFWITDVNLRKQHKEGLIRISAVLQIAATKHGSLSYYAGATEELKIVKGFSSVTVLLQGIYTESESERIICMLGCAQIPIAGTRAVTRSCNLQLEIHFPKHLSLRSRIIHGSLRSLTKGEFEEIKISSQLGAYSNYEFRDSDLVKMSCSSSHLLRLPTGIKVYRGERFCSTAMELLNGPWGEWIINSNSNKSSDKIFTGTEKMKKMSEHMMIKDVRCVEFEDEKNGEKKANVSVIIRALISNEDPTISSSLEDGLSIAAEGIFQASTGQLCMIGCRSSICDINICIYIPITLSITQHSSLVGKISIIRKKEEEELAPELWFHMKAFSGNLPTNAEYIYSDMVDAIDVDQQQKGLSDKLKMSLLKFPSKDEGLTQLSQDLSVNSQLIPSEEEHKQRLNSSSSSYSRFLYIELLAIENNMLLRWSNDNFSADHHRPHSENPRVKIALQLSITGYRSLPVIYGEGVYSPATGKLFLLGCMQPSSNSSDGDDDLVDGLDCKIKIQVHYPPMNAQWLVNPTVVTVITSTRNSKDHLFFEDITFKTFPVLYRQQLREILSRKTIEGALSVVTLSLMILCIALQLVYVKSASTQSVPYISLLMLAVQAIGYSIPLITGAEALFARLTSSDSDQDSSTYSTPGINQGQIGQIVLYFVKILSLLAFLLMLRLCQKVVKSRIRLRTRHPLEPHKVPSDRTNLKLFAAIHSLGFLLIYAFAAYRTSTPEGPNSYVDWNGNTGHPLLVKELKEYAGLVQDLFLMPQVIGTAMWDIKGKPLRRSYYIGITALRLLPHVYDIFRRPLFNPYFSDELLFANPKLDFYSRVGDLLIPALAVLLAAAVYAQQRWNELKWGKIVRTGSYRLLRMGSKMYERLPSLNGEEGSASVSVPERAKSPLSRSSVEAELMPSTNAAFV